MVSSVYLVPSFSVSRQQKFDLFFSVLGASSIFAIHINFYVLQIFFFMKEKYIFYHFFHAVDLIFMLP